LVVYVLRIGFGIPIRDNHAAPYWQTFLQDMADAVVISPLSAVKISATWN
jgi:predicted nucleotide-binding protein (sugar kinase/HSP70/actin superfamily)